MVVLTTIRRSPAYLYLKTYCLCALVTLFQATPVSSRLPRLGGRVDNSGNRGASVNRKFPTLSELPSKKSGGQYGGDVSSVSSNERVRTLKRYTHTCVVIGRWWRRTIDLVQIKDLLRQDSRDIRIYPELGWDATVRRSSSLHEDEKRFIGLRKQRISSQGANSLHAFIELPENENVDAQDVPLMALGGSGGGYRAMYGFSGFISASKKLGLWDCLTWTAGVSGSCWVLAAYYTIASHSVSKLVRHYLTVAKEHSHPLSLSGLNIVSRSSNGVYFLIGPLLQKARSGIIGLGIMDIYATLTTAYQFLPRSAGGRLSRGTFQFSKVWTRSGLDQAMEPMPIFTAVRKAPKGSDGVKPHTDSSISKGQPPSRALVQHCTVLLNDPATKSKRGRRADSPDKPFAKGFFQWFEISPLEVGSTDSHGYIPTWSWGRSFVSGRSVDRSPEQSLSLLLGQCTSAPAGPLTVYISALLASLPKGTIMSRVLLLLNDFVRMKRWERLWGNPIRSGHDPNPFYGINPFLDTQRKADTGGSIDDNIAETQDKLLKDVVQINASDSSPGRESSLSTNCMGNDETAVPVLWEPQGRIRLMDGGISNNLPNHILARPERCADIILSFDASSDVRTGSAMRRIYHFGEDCHIELEDRTAMFDPPQAHFARSGTETTRSTGEEVESKFLHQYARVFRGTRDNGEEVYVIYCPLLPNGMNPEFDPSMASFCNSYNLAWTPEQVKTLLATSEANLERYVVETIKRVARAVYQTKKSKRLASPSS